MSIRLGLFLSVLGTCAGCAIVQSPQVYPDEWNEMDRRSTSENSALGTDAPRTLTQEELRQLAQPPSDLDDSIARTFKLFRHYTLRENSVDSVPQDVGNFLIGLMTFAAYKGITHPSAKTTAGAAALGTAAYAAGTGVDWSERAAAYNRAGGKLLCLLDEAHAFVIYPAQSGTTKDNMNGREQLVAAQTDVRAKLGVLDDLLARHAALEQTYLVAPASVSKSPCVDPQWDAQACKVPAGSEGSRFQGICQHLQARRARLCATHKRVAVHSTPPAEVVATFQAAWSVRNGAEASLEKSASVLSTSDRAGRKLWQATLSAMNKANVDVRRTGIDLAELMSQMKAAQQDKSASTVMGKTQSGAPGAPPPPAPRPRVLDDATARILVALKTALQQAHSADIALNAVLAANRDIPPSVQSIRFDACVSPEAKVTQAVVSASSTVAEQDAGDPVVVPTSADRAALSLLSDAPQADVETRVRACQKRKGMLEDGRFTVSMQLIVRSGECRVIK